MMYYGMFSPFHIFGLGPIFMLGFWIIVGYVIYKIIKKSSRTLGGTSKAIEIIKERYANGEITKEQFETLKKDLS